MPISPCHPHQSFPYLPPTPHQTTYPGHYGIFDLQQHDQLAQPILKCPPHLGLHLKNQSCHNSPEPSTHKAKLDGTISSMDELQPIGKLPYKPITVSNNLAPPSPWTNGCEPPSIPFGHWHSPYGANAMLLSTAPIVHSHWNENEKKLIHRPRWSIKKHSETFYHRIALSYTMPASIIF